MPRKRSPDIETINRMAARKFVVPLVAKIGPLVDRAIFLETVASRRNTCHPQLRREAALLADEARVDLANLDLQLAAMKEGITAHAHVVDARRALIAVVDRFERARLSL
jgi:hypothetical protein